MLPAQTLFVPFGPLRLHLQLLAHTSGLEPIKFLLSLLGKLMQSASALLGSQGLARVLDDVVWQLHRKPKGARCYGRQPGIRARAARPSSGPDGSYNTAGRFRMRCGSRDDWGGEGRACHVSFMFGALARVS